jgi:hypothetical protein
MDWWRSDGSVEWLGNLTTWWIVAPLVVVLFAWGALKLSQSPRVTNRRMQRSLRGH